MSPVLIPPHERRRNAFTLIELLVVVAIIALLISILLPTLQRAKDQARALKCATHERALYSAASLYAADNKDYMPRAIQANGDINDPGRAYAFFASAILPYLGWSGSPRELHGRPPQRRYLMETCRSFEVFHCPSYPVIYETNPDDRVEHQPGRNPSHYITSAFPMPYPKSVYDNEDEQDLIWSEDAAWEGVPVSEGGYEGASRLEDFPVEAQPSTKIYITEVDKSIPWQPTGTGMRFYAFFRTSHLPFAGKPRIGEDDRHNNAFNCTFFDGHTEIIDLHKIDPGYPTEHAKRLRLFTIMFDGYQP